MQYAVVKDKFEKTFTHIHLDEIEAHEEAKRLCRKENHDFLVIQILGRYSQEDKPLAYEKLT